MNENITEALPAPTNAAPEAGPEVRATAPRAAPELPGVFATIGALPPGALVTESGLAEILGKCTASIKAAVKRGELPGLAESWERTPGRRGRSSGTLKTGWKKKIRNSSDCALDFEASIK